MDTLGAPLRNDVTPKQVSESVAGPHPGDVLLNKSLENISLKNIWLKHGCPGE
jgi:hypothetical protein